MKKLVPLALMWLSITLLCILENVWIENRLPIPDRIDLYNKQGILLKEKLNIITKENPDWDVIAVFETTGVLSLEKNQAVSVLAVSSYYMSYNPIHMIRGAFDIDRAVIIRRETAYNLFNSDDVVGEQIIFNGELHLISGIFEVSPLIKELGIPSPDILISLNNTALKKTGINLLQIRSDSKIDVNDLYTYLDVKAQKNLNINQRFALVKQFRNFLYLSLGTLIFSGIISIFKKNFLKRKKIYKEKIKTMYRAACLKMIIGLDPFIYIIYTPVLIGLAVILWFNPYIPPEVLSHITGKKILLSPVKFIMNRTMSINPVVVLPQILETMSFTIFLFLYLPFFFLLCRIEQVSLKHSLFLPLINISFTLLFILLGIEPVFDFKINLLLFLFITVSASRDSERPAGIYYNSNCNMKIKGQ
ncbi:MULTISPECIES: ABC transporter permease [unclassified Oceanispirochaeta]|uniref:ABC transporter permease n=1 Tax=unclassified Oceanispirochaeta TaxID=2635722 RepID=UPI000E091CFA|nr:MULTISPECIES: ABC transporter permease [unclassified Oceanispirochaeta]MBF9015667.1 ABC transporter permease [Oceanispirochaeta sp. M2]NPD73441.1 ABC transporter permease [Oceanispirochaeta sp. M1]RDG30914.1 hypothetical protein DV872_15170 [Oceanispirochaeta sp. M1]